MIKQFLKRKWRSLLIGFGIWSILFAIKIIWPEDFAESRLRYAGNLWLIFGLPAAIAWDWFDFKKSVSKNEN